MNWKASVREQSWPNMLLACHPNIYWREWETPEFSQNDWPLGREMRYGQGVILEYKAEVLAI